MSSRSTGQVTNSLGIVLPARIAAIVDDCERHPEHGNVLNEIYKHSERMKSDSQSSKKKRRVVEKNKGQPSSQQFSRTSCTPSGMPIFEGSVVICGDNDITVTDCTGYLVSLCPGPDSCAVVVLDIRGKGLVPCLCPLPLIDESSMKACRIFNEGQYDKRKEIS